MRVWRPSAKARDPSSPVVRRHRPDYQIVLFMGLLMMIGLVVLYSISPARVELINANTNSSLDAAHFMQRQLVSLAVGLAVFFMAGFVPTTYWKRYAWPLLLLGFGACALLAVLGLMMDSGPIIKTNGAVRWFNLGFMSFQPAELLKFGCIIYTAVFLGRQIKTGKLNDLAATLLPLGIVFAAACLFIIVFQKDMGTGITLLGALAALLFAAGVDKRWLAIGTAAICGLGVLLILTSPHRVERVMTFLQSSTSSTQSASDTTSYHINQAMIALGSGGMFGKGLGQGVQAFGYLPEAVNDSIFAILGETFGFLGLVIIMLLFGLLLRRVLITAERTVDVTDRLIVVGIFGLIASHIVVNIGAMTGIFPLTGVTLPFLSFGGTSLLFTSLGLGVIFYISRYTTHQRIIEQEGSSEATMRRRGIRRPRYAGSRGHQ